LEDSQLQVIGAGAFAESGLTAIAIPPKVNRIGERCFEVLWVYTASLLPIARSQFCQNICSARLPSPKLLFRARLSGLLPSVSTAPTN
jgi:hypothetical protein